MLATYLERYPSGEFAAIARTLSEHYDRKLKAEQAAQEEERKRIEEERKAAEVKRLEEERRAREAAIADENKRAEKARGVEEARRLEEQQRTELVKRTEELRKALEEAQLAREAAKAAEEQRVAAVKTAEEATKAANDAIALKRDSCWAVRQVHGCCSPLRMFWCLNSGGGLYYPCTFRLRARCLGERAEKGPLIGALPDTEALLGTAAPFGLLDI